MQKAWTLWQQSDMHTEKQNFLNNHENTKNAFGFTQNFALEHQNKTKTVAKTCYRVVKNAKKCTLWQQSDIAYGKTKFPQQP